MTLSRRWLLIIALAMLVAWVVRSIHVSTDGRKLGSIEDLATLGERKDLNVLFVLVDTLRADRLHAYGYARETSPVLDALAADGIRFAQHMSQSSWTKASMASLWTGLYPARTQIHRFQHAIPDEARMPAEILREAGFRTFGIWRNGWVAPNFGFHQGFESYHSPRISKIPDEVRQENPTLVVKATDTDVIDSTLTFLRSYRNERWFLYLHMMDLHQYTYDKESALFGTGYSDIYDNSIRRADRLLGVIVNELVSLGLRGRTLVVLASDHGEAFGEHGHEGHARDLYHEVTTTPFIVSLPFRLPEAVVVETHTQNVDIWPTLLELLHLPGLPDPDGRSRVPEILAAAQGRPDAAPDTAPRFAQLDRSWGRVDEEPSPIVSVTEGRFRLIEPVGEPDKAELFELDTDPREQANRVSDEPEVAARLRAQVDAYLGSAPPPWKPNEVKVDDMDLKQLRALGYVIE